MKSTIIVCALMLMAFVYGSWRNNGSAAATRAEKDLRLEIMENVFGGHAAAGASDNSGTNPSATRSAKDAPYGNGRPVPKSEYQPCLDSFVAVMGRYGIKPGASVPFSGCPSMTYPITTAESFQGSGLLTWIQNVVMTYDSAAKGANMDFQLQFGVYTPTFVKDLGQDASLTGRITTFIVPVYRTTTAAAAAKVAGRARAKRLGASSDPSGSGYELGGLQP